MAIQQLVLEKYDEPTWERIKTEARVDVDTFMSLEAYPDTVTYDLVAAASRILEIPADALLEAFGEYWVLYTGKAGYGYLMDPSTSSLTEFLVDLNQLHQRIRMTFPHLQPPHIVCTDVCDESLRLHYYSDRPGLAPMVKGLVKGLGIMFQRNLDITQVAFKGQETDHDEFVIVYH
jgi:hypothetical protein